jgi:hypothetical protein
MHESDLKIKPTWDKLKEQSARAFGKFFLKDDRGALNGNVEKQAVPSSANH